MVEGVETVMLGEAMLRLSTSGEGWCSVELIDGGDVIPLGADLRSLVVQRFGRGLQEDAPKATSGEIGRVAVGAFITLFERYCTVYAAQTGGERVLFFQAADGTLLRRISLSASAREAAFYQLELMRQARWPGRT